MIVATFGDRMEAEECLPCVDVLCDVSNHP